jgi:hypothetical protein
MRLRALVPVLLLPSLVFAQRVEITTTTAPVNTLTISDVDFVNSTTPKWLFTIQLAVQPSTQTASGVLKLTLDANLASGETYPAAVYFESIPITVTGIRILTNLDLASPALRRTYRLDQAAKQRFEDVALPAGMMPPGHYVFRVEFEQLSNGTTEGGFTIDLTNPSSIELLSPLDGEVTVTEFPMFQWQYDGQKSKISLYERLPGQSSYEEVISGVPLLGTETSGKSFQYPTAGARTLEPGKTYVWYVEGIVGVSAGTKAAIRSRLSSFTIAGRGGVQQTSLLDALEQALGPEYRPLFDQLRSDGYQPAGTLRLDGRALSVPEFMRLISQFRANPAAVLSVQVE